jgi:hypothetical protein
MPGPDAMVLLTDVKYNYSSLEDFCPVGPSRQTYLSDAAEIHHVAERTPG